MSGAVQRGARGECDTMLSSTRACACTSSTDTRTTKHTVSEVCPPPTRISHPARPQVPTPQSPSRTADVTTDVTTHNTQHNTPHPSECSKHTTHNGRHTNDSTHASQSPHTKPHRARAQAQRIAHHGQRADGEQDTHRLRVPFKESGQKGTQPAWGKLGRQARKV